MMIADGDTKKIAECTKKNQNGFESSHWPFKKEIKILQNRQLTNKKTL